VASKTLVERTAVSDPLRVSVVIPSYHRLERLPALVEQYLGLGADEVVVVLDGPHDGWQAALGTVT